jgi:CDGSH-type Zn-finger protein
VTDPKIAAKAPVVLELEPGTYFWCTCGHSTKQPFCDGAHKGSQFRPYKFELEAKTKLALCQCKHTGSTPNCDGSHSRF